MAPVTVVLAIVLLQACLASQGWSEVKSSPEGELTLLIDAIMKQDLRSVMSILRDSPALLPYSSHYQGQWFTSLSAAARFDRKRGAPILSALLNAIPADLLPNYLNTKADDGSGVGPTPTVTAAMAKNPDTLAKLLDVGGSPYTVVYRGNRRGYSPTALRAVKTPVPWKLLDGETGGTRADGEQCLKLLHEATSKHLDLNVPRETRKSRCLPGESCNIQ